MKTAVLLHGTGGSDKDYFWFSDTKQYLENNGYKVWWPLLPNTDKPVLLEGLEFLQHNMPKLNEDSIIIGHSSACPLILSFLQRQNHKVNQVLLVSGFYQSLNDDGFSGLMLEKYDWEKIKQTANEFIFINSDDDPWGCDDRQARPAAEKLGARLIVAKGQGHMGSNSFNQPCRELTILKELIAGSTG